MRRGANAIEFGLTCPVFFGIILGLMDYGWLFANQAGINNASALGCREGALVDPVLASPSAAAMADVTSRASMFCTGAACSYNVQDLQTGVYAVPNRTLACTVTMNYAPLIGFVPLPATITSSSYYRLEWQR
jgi:Flp pilus assembly protein TadG